MKSEMTHAGMMIDVEYDYDPPDRSVGFGESITLLSVVVTEAEDCTDVLGKDIISELNKHEVALIGEQISERMADWRREVKESHVYRRFEE